MENYIIGAIIILAVIFSIRPTIKHFKGQGGCCGGDSYKPKKKKLKNVRYQKTFKIEGMHCEQCKNKVERTVNDIKGITGKVSLKKGELTVFYAEKVNDERIKECIEKAGYKII